MLYDGLLILDYYIFQIRHLKLKEDFQGFGMSIKPEESVKVKFSNIAGNEEAVHSVEELIDFIHNPEKYTQYGARLPRGVILYGPPGTEDPSGKSHSR